MQLEDSRLRFGIEAAQIGIWELKLDTRMVVWDATCQLFFGHPGRPELPLDEALRFIHPEDLPAVQSALGSALAGDRGGHYEMRHRITTDDRSVMRWVHIKGRVYFDEAGAAIQFGGIAQDVTDIMDMLAEVKAAKDRADRFTKDVFVHSPVAKMVLTGPTLVIERVNVQMMTLLQITAQTAGQPLQTVLSEAENRIFFQRIKEVAASGINYEELRQPLRLHKGSAWRTRYFDVKVKKVDEVPNEQLAIMWTAIDVTSQIEAQRLAEQTSAQLASAIEVAELGTWQVDVNTGSLELSARLRKWLGVDRQDNVSLEEVLTKMKLEDAQILRTALKQNRQSVNPGMYDLEIGIRPFHDSLLRIVRVRGITRYLPDGSPDFVVGSAQDVTLQRDLQKALELDIQQRTEELHASNEELAATNEELAATNQEFSQMNTSLVQSNQDLQQFAHVISHDLKEPIRKIKLFLDRTLKDSDVVHSQRSQHDLVRAGKSADRMFSMIDGVLAFSQLNSFELTVEQVNLNETMVQIGEDLDLLFAEKNVTLTCGLLPVVEGVAVLLYQLFYNLLINAVKFSSDQRRSQISVDATTIHLSGKAFTQIVVKDNGIGFDPRYAEFIFDTFTRLHTKDAYEGTGLGLSLCRKIAQRHGGSIVAFGHPGAGAEFLLQLPLIYNKRR